MLRPFKCRVKYFTGTNPLFRQRQHCSVDIFAKITLLENHKFVVKIKANAICFAKREDCITSMGNKKAFLKIKRMPKTFLRGMKRFERKR